MPSFEFATANRIIFGAGKLNGLGDQLKGRAKRLLLVTGRSSDAIPRVRQILSAQGIPFDEFALHGEPTVDTASEGVKLALERGCDMVIGLGGGSVLDAGKAIAALATNPGDIFDYLEVVGKGQALINAPLTYIAIPTTAGTGTEVTRNAVLESPAHGVKVSLRSPLMLPSIALVDPELTYTLPPPITASTGLDALTQLIEPFVSVKANPLTDAICRAGIRHAARSLRRAYENGADQEARAGMSLASLFGGMALANSALGAVHGFAGSLGGMLHAPHGATCAKLLPLVMEANLKAMISREPNHPALARYAEVAQILTGDKNATASDGVQWVSELVCDLNIPMLSVYGMTSEHFSDAVEKTLKASSTKGNPIILTEGELREILEIAL
ncbi:iron-containing alcohol dehydrogenase [Candidatus Villigracilis saccharophilus]|uniref:iron-containing alcohol dehydrogenase n=1 Tax=Candidatus Villigracilis saccharophilus TaxID=3140684 RepID=UPI0031362DC2|nr:iron-containing alcohol dehydrogenase [Anaerolineales bacterium]